MWRRWPWTKRGRAAATAVAAQIRYVAPGSGRPVSNVPDPARTSIPHVDVAMQVHDGRRAQQPPAITREGFALLSHRSGVTDFADPDQLQRIHLAEAEALVREVSGARHAFALPRPVLRSEHHEPAGRAELLASHPAPIAHCDFTDRSIGGMVAAVLPRAGLAEPPGERVAVFNVWRSLRAPPQDRPLALCDVRTVAADDLVRADSIGDNATAEYEAEFYLVRPNPAHRWCYFSAMTPDEVLVFRQFDSALPAPSGCPHTAFEDPMCPPGALPRLSIETRVCAFL